MIMDNWMEVATLIPRPHEWRSGLRHCISVLEASLQTLVQFQAVSQPAVIVPRRMGLPIGLASSGLGFGRGRPSL